MSEALQEIAMIKGVVPVESKMYTGTSTALSTTSGELIVIASNIAALRCAYMSITGSANFNNEMAREVCVVSNNSVTKGQDSIKSELCEMLSDAADSLYQSSVEDDINLAGDIRELLAKARGEK